MYTKAEIKQTKTTLQRIKNRLRIISNYIFGHKETRIKEVGIEKIPKWKKGNDANVIEYKFTINNIDYFGFTSELSIGNARGSVGYGFIEEFHLRFTKEHFDASYLAIIESLNKGNIVDAVVILTNLKERRDWVFEPITVLKLASVLYFDKNENPYTYDWDYNQKKIKSWLQIDNIMINFFLRLPLIHSLIHLELSDTALVSCLRSLTKLTKSQQQLLIDSFHNEDMKTVAKNLLTYEQEILVALTLKD